MQSEQTRHRKREQRRRTREEKRQALRSGTPLGGIPAPRTAISDVLLEYVGPLVERLSLAARPEQLRTLLQLAAIVWNAMLDASGEPEDDARRMIARMQSRFWTPPPTAVIDWLARRRILRYGHDPRLIASADVVRENDGIRVIATAEPQGARRSASRLETSAGQASNPPRTGHVGGGC
jgi:hypothetical protein